MPTKLSSVFGLAALVLAVAGVQSASAQPDPYHITATEKSACTADAVRLCSSAYPDEGKLLTCMMSNKASLTSGCAAVFDAGLRRRRLVSR